MTLLISKDSLNSTQCENVPNSLENSEYKCSFNLSSNFSILAGEKNQILVTECYITAAYRGLLSVPISFGCLNL
jgi:hypothetical protein